MNDNIPLELKLQMLEDDLFTSSHNMDDKNRLRFFELLMKKKEIEVIEARTKQIQELQEKKGGFINE